MTETKFYPSNIHPCFWCGSSNRSAMAKRLDGMPILQCQNCYHFAVQSVPINLDELYQGEDYYHADGSSGLGYQDYNSLPLVNWSVELLGSLMLVEGKAAPSGLSLLDIGCATGYYLDFFKEFGWQTFGSDLSGYAQEVCRSKGHTIVDLSDFETGRGSGFSVVTAFHVIEHLTDFEKFFEVVNGFIDLGAQLFFVVPSVDFSEVSWNGQNSSFEHISYFDHKFVKDNFAAEIQSLGVVLSLGSLVCGFAGPLSPELTAVLLLLEEIASLRVIDRSHRDRLAHVTAVQLAFMASFLARACSAALALELLESVKCDRGDRDWLDLAKALAYFQNDNCYGAAAALGQLRGATPEAKFLKDRGVAELLPTQQRLKSQSSPFPLINIVSLCDAKNPIQQEFFLSAGEQTYPNINMVHLLSDSPCSCHIPEYYRELIELRAGPGGSVCQALLRETASSSDSFILLCDGRAALSKYCLFALQHCIEQTKVPFAVPAPADRYFVPSWLPGRRTILRVIQRFSDFEATAVMFGQESVAYLPRFFANEQCAKPENIVRAVPPHLVTKSADVLATLLP